MRRALRPAALGLLSLLAVSASASAQDAGRPLYAAHRGGSLLWPENSLLAFRSAADLGADYLEMDVHLSRDGEVVVIHDPTLDRTTTGAGPVADRTLAELRQLRLKDGEGTVTGESIPTLDEVLAVAARSGRRMLIEIKVDHRRQRYPSIEERVLALVDRHRMAGRIVLMAFEGETWRRVREVRPDVAAGALYSRRMVAGGPASVAAVLEQAGRAGVAFVGLDQALVDADAAGAARRAGVTLGVWTVNEREALARVIRDGAGIVITDRPDLARELLGR